MNADLVQRLRNGVGHVPEDILEAEGTMDEAADRIEELEGQVRRLHDRLFAKIDTETMKAMAYSWRGR